MRLFKTICGFALVLTLVPSGCSSAKRDRPQTFPVHGELFVDGKPAAGARVQLTSLGDEKLARLAPHAIVEADGSFRLTTFQTGDGAPIATYALTLTWAAPPQPGHEEGPDRFRGRFADPRRPVREVQIHAGDNDLGRLDLK
jgi:hypothetical protein